MDLAGSSFRRHRRLLAGLPALLLIGLFALPAAAFWWPTLVAVFGMIGALEQRFRGEVSMSILLHTMGSEVIAREASQWPGRKVLWENSEQQMTKIAPHFSRGSGATGLIFPTSFDYICCAITRAVYCERSLCGTSTITGKIKRITKCWKMDGLQQQTVVKLLSKEGKSARFKVMGIF